MAVNTTESVYDRIVRANFGVLSREEQERLRRSGVTIVGAGGAGGQASIQCTRLGIGRIRIIDKDVFEHSNLNRQMLGTVTTVGQPKALAARDYLSTINPDLQVEGVEAWVTEENARDMLAGAGVVIDCTDNLVSRVVIHRTARELGIPSVWIAITPPFRGAVATFLPSGMAYEEALGVPSRGLPLTDKVRRAVLGQKDDRARHAVERGALQEWAGDYLEGRRPWAVITPVAAIVGALAAFEAMKVLIARPSLPPTVAPRLVVLDLARPEMVLAADPPDGRAWRYEEL